MKRFKCKRLIKALGIALISSSALYGVTSLTAANAQDPEPHSGPGLIFPNLTKELCMADAYLEADDRNSLPSDALNCTANDVEITAVLNPSKSECSIGEIIDFDADIVVRTNANERWDTTFYLPLTNQTPKNISLELAGAPSELTFPYYCSIVLPNGQKAATEGQTFATLDGDACADITKKYGNDSYVLNQQPIEMLCIDKDDDGQADFHYCAAWDNQERNNCTEARDPVPGQIPNTKSKCNCDTLNIPIFIKPTPPTITKTLISSDTVDEPGGLFKYKVDITNTSPKSDIFIQSVKDIIRSSTDNTVFANFDLTTTTDTQIGDNLTLVATHVDHTCDTALAEVPGLKLSVASPQKTCYIMVKVDDDDLPDDGTDELYQDFIRVEAIDKNDAAVGDDNCDPTRPDSAGGPLNPAGATCSNVETVKVQDVDPDIDIDKFSISGPNWTCYMGDIGNDGKCSGTVFIDEPGGDVTYKLVIKNTSSVDPLTITSLKDVVDTASIDLLTDISGNSCDDSLPINLALAGETGDTFECTFKRVVSGALRTVKNTATVIASEKNGHSEGNTATANDFAEVTIIDVAPTAVFNKQVSLDGVTFAKSVEVDEPGGDVVYKFSVKNTSPAKETIRLLSLTDPVLSGSRVTPTAGSTCKFDGTVSIAYNVTYSCTFPAAVTGEPDNQLDNTAYVTITDEESNIDSNTSSATVTFKDIPANANLTVNLSTRVFVTVNNLSTFEDIKLTHLKIAGLNIEDLDLTHYNIINDGFGEFAGDGHTYGACHQPSAIDPQTIAKNDAYRCSFRVEVLTDTDTAPNLLSHIGGTVPTEPSGILTIKVEDFDGGAVQDKDATVFVHLEPSQ
ncbi:MULTISPECIES: hypothetical protein [unclassified Shewanella]|uniref:hypothetical protein n=1 Tax=unclassified Shewanella TaxID=196818 RepID=UPI001C7D76A4|nr:MULTISPECIES: hypothetical protein [unclassified Shewanella]